MKSILVKNAAIVTLNPDLPRAEEMLIQDGWITQLGKRGELSRVGRGYTLDLKGKTVLPGLIDSHLHMLSAGLTGLQVDVSGCRGMDIPALLAYVRQQAGGRGGWIRGFGLDETGLTEGRMPRAVDLDRVFPESPVILTRVCGHVSVINSAAIRALEHSAGADAVRRRLGRGEDGAPDGLAAENAQQFVLDHIPAPTDEAVAHGLAQAQRVLLEQGICSIHDAGTDQLSTEEYVRHYLAFAEAGRLKLRTYLMVRSMPEKDDRWLPDYLNRLKQAFSPQRDRLFFGAVKLFADGSLGGRTAALYEGYGDAGENTGLLQREMLDRYIVPCHENGFQVAVHAIGDRAVEYAVDRMAEGIRKKPGAPLRHRIEHCELCNHRTRRKMAENGILAMMQPVFIREFGANYQQVLSPLRAAQADPIRSLGEAGIPIGFGTDYPVDSPNPFLGMHAAATRLMPQNGTALNAAEAISPEAALRAYTLGSAYGSVTEELQGSLQVGKAGDFVVVDGDYETLLKQKWENTRVLMTVIGGEVLYHTREMADS